ncbi:hypothetical protein AAF712_012532 [Marasmius tenuissimus]|uniref:UBR-type domain-containing protein n=1 Tax=Marasmius tenuissimus TaxID=585030 RepID=A0ABR2ZH28_9AGAR
MIQCLVCEDWFHESCCHLRERPSSRGPTPDPDLQEEGKDNADDNQSEASSSGLPPPLLKGDDYEAFICFSCVSDNPILQRYAGSPGCLMVIKDDSTSPWRLLSNQTSETDVVNITEPSETISGAQKRPISPSSSTEQETKRQRLSPSGSGTRCLAPSPNPLIERVYSQPDSDKTLGAGDLFFTEGFRDRFCRCSACLPCLEVNRCLLEEEDTYEPPTDPDSGLSLEELGMRALSRLPRDRAIDGIHAFNTMREDLVQYLRPFAQDGKVVSESDVKTFFENLLEKQRGQD